MAGGGRCGNDNSTRRTQVDHSLFFPKVLQRILSIFVYRFRSMNMHEQKIHSKIQMTT